MLSGRICCVRSICTARATICSLLFLSDCTLIICEAKSLIFKTNNILDALDLTLEENSAIFEPIGIAIVEGYLPEYLADSGYDQHLISGQNSLEALRKRA